MATSVTNDTKTEQPSVAKSPIAWKQTILVGLLTGLAWSAILFLPIVFGNESLQNLSLLAGIAPVIGGIYLGRRLQDRALVHGLLLAVFAVIAALAVATPIILTADTAFLAGAQPPAGTAITKSGTFVSLLTLMLITLVPFPIYGTIISVRNKQRLNQYKEEANRRGGQLQRPGRIANLDDLQALPLPKFGSWVAQLFKNNGFLLDDYEFTKDVVDLHMTRKEHNEKWLVRCTVADAIKPGMAQQLAQDMRDGNWQKGIVATSTVVQEGTRKWLKGRNTIEALDGETLMDMHG